MKKNRKITKTLLILYGLCAVIWTAGTIMKLVYGTTVLDITLSLLCAVIWTFLLIIMIRRYRNQRETDE